MVRKKEYYNWKINVAAYISFMILSPLLFVDAKLIVMFGPVFFLLALVLFIISIRAYNSYKKEQKPDNMLKVLFISNIIFMILSAILLIMTTKMLFSFILFPPEYAPMM